MSQNSNHFSKDLSIDVYVPVLSKSSHWFRRDSAHWDFYRAVITAMTLHIWSYYVPDDLEHNVKVMQI